MTGPLCPVCKELFGLDHYCRCDPVPLVSSAVQQVFGRIMIKETVEVSEEEMAKLIQWAAQTGEVVDMVFGIRGVALTWERNKPLPLAVRHLALLRGVGSENRDGAGI